MRKFTTELDSKFAFRTDTKFLIVPVSRKPRYADHSPVVYGNVLRITTNLLSQLSSTLLATRSVLGGN